MTEPARREPAGLSVGFGLERIGLLAVNHPRIIVFIVVILTAYTGLGIGKLQFRDDLESLFRSSSETYRTYETFQARFADGTNTAVLLVEGDFSRRSNWEVLRTLSDAISELEPLTGTASIFTLVELERAAGPPAEDIFESDDPAAVEEVRSAPVPELPEELAAHPLNRGFFLSEDLRRAAIMMALGSGKERLSRAGRLKAELEVLLAGLPKGMTTTLGGIPIVRLEMISHITSEMPILLGAGILIGLGLGVVLLGVVADAIVVSVMPILCLLWVYGLLAHLGIGMTPLLFDLPLLVLALAFASSMHLVYASRRDLFGAGYDFTAIRRTILIVGPACVLSTLTTIIAFLTFLFAESKAIAEFGLMGAGGLTGVFVASMVIHPAVVWVALKFGWRPKPASRGPGRTARGMEAACLIAAKTLHRVRLPVAVLAVAAVGAAGWAHFQVEPRFHLMEDVPRASATYRLQTRFEADLGGSLSMHLPLPVVLEEGVPDPLVQRTLQRAHEAAETAFPDHLIYSPWTVVRWLTATDRPVSAPRLQAVAGADKGGLGGLFISSDGRTPALIVIAGAGDSAELGAVVARLERAVGTAIGADLTGQATGFAVLAARSSPSVIRRLSYGLVAAALGASVVVAVGFRSVRVFFLTFIPNLLPVLAVGAILYLLNLPLQFPSAIAMTTALGIAVDDTVHLLNSYRHQCGTSQARLALARAMRRVGPVLVTTSAVLMLGLAPALFSWSPAIGIFSFFTIVTIGVALLCNLFILPGLLGISGRIHAPPGGSI